MADRGYREAPSPGRNDPETRPPQASSGPARVPIGPSRLDYNPCSADVPRGTLLTTVDREPAALLAEGAAALELDLTESQRRALLELADLLTTWAQRLNLTAHRTPAAIVHRLILDALALAQRLPAVDRIVDLGSGAGFPGLPLAVLRPEVELVLVEARERRHHFQRTAVRALGLSGVRPLHGRIETLEPVSSAGVVAQALAEPRRAVELALRWCAPGGWIAVPGAETPPQPGPLAGIASAEILRYAVPCAGPSRSLWLGVREE